MEFASLSGLLPSIEMYVTQRHERKVDPAGIFLLLLKMLEIIWIIDQKNMLFQLQCRKRDGQVSTDREMLFLRGGAFRGENSIFTILMLAFSRLNLIRVISIML